MEEPQCPTTPTLRTILDETPHAASNLADEKNSAPPAPFFDENTSRARESTWREPEQRHSPLYKAFQWTVLLMLFAGFSAFFALEHYFFSPLMVIVWGGIMLVVIVVAMVGWIEWYVR